MIYKNKILIKKIKKIDIKIKIFLLVSINK